MVAVTGNDERVETGIFGREGMSTCGVLLGILTLSYEIFLQGGDAGHEISVDALIKVANDQPSLRDHFLRWQHAFSVQTAYTALANGRYTIEGRLARWLLMCDDRTEGSDMALTHKFLGVMLAVRRSGVTDSLNGLKEQGLIDTRRGVIRIIDRSALLSTAGAAYGYPEAEYEQMFGAKVISDRTAR